MFKEFAKEIKVGAFALVALVAMVVAFNCYTVVDTGSVKVGRFLGKVQPEPLTEGFHVVNPFMDFKTFNTKEKTTNISITIPAQDKFDSTAELSIRWSFNGNNAPVILSELGSEAALESNIVRTPLISLIKEAGRSVKKSQDLFLEKTQKLVENKIKSGLVEETAKYGITIHAVYLGNIKLDPIIQSAIVKTKRLQEETDQQQAKLDRESLEYQRVVKKAEADNTAAEKESEARRQRADAKLYEQKAESDAKLYDAQKQAKANLELGKSITPALLQLKKLEIDMKRAENWKGGVPSTIMGDANKALPLFKLN